MQILRTPDERFVNLPGYGFVPHYIEIDAFESGGTDSTKLRLHYVDEGPRDGQVVLMMHGEPSWCYLYRKMIPIIAAAGHRAIAVDLVGFGRSDKPAQQSDYSYARHVGWINTFVDTLDLQDITLVAQDWGGLVGLRLVAAQPDRFCRVVVGNTGLPEGGQEPPQEFKDWLAFSQSVPELPVGDIITGTALTTISADIKAAYDAPFPDESYKAGARIFPALVPFAADDPGAIDNRKAWQVLERFEKPFLTAFSDSDPMTIGSEAIFQGRIPGAKNQPHTTIKHAGHFLQEEQGEAFAKVVNRFIAANPV